MNGMADDNNRTQKTDTTMFPVCCILIGAVFLLFPEWVMGTLSFILGGLCILYGAWKLIGALRGSGFTRGGAVLGGTAAVLLGIYVIRHPAQIFSLLPLVDGRKAEKTLLFRLYHRHGDASVRRDSADASV